MKGNLSQVIGKKALFDVDGTISIDGLIKNFSDFSNITFGNGKAYLEMQTGEKYWVDFAKGNNVKISVRNMKNYPRDIDIKGNIDINKVIKNKKL